MVLDAASSEAEDSRSRKRRGYRTRCRRAVRLEYGGIFGNKRRPIGNAWRTRERCHDVYVAGRPSSRALHLLTKTAVNPWMPPITPMECSARLGGTRTIKELPPPFVVQSRDESSNSVVG